MTLFYLQDFIETTPEDSAMAATVPTFDDLAYIMYTSGTGPWCTVWCPGLCLHLGLCARPDVPPPLPKARPETQRACA